MEQQIVARESRLPYRGLPAAALRGRNPLVLSINTTRLASGVAAALVLLRQQRPAAILGTGGYVCVPLFVAAWLLRIPTLIYLPDVVPGFAVRFLARIATLVACSVEDTRAHLNTRTLLVCGYPVRPALQHLQRDACRAAFGLRPDQPVLLVYGGSRGARSINRAIAHLLPHLLPITQIIHICGREGDEEWLRNAASQLPPALHARYVLAPYLESPPLALEEEPAGAQPAGAQQPAIPAMPTMPAAFGAADLALCRSGASVLGELPILGLPAILVPYPYVNQEQNADYLVRHGAAHKLNDAELHPQGEPQQHPLMRQLVPLLSTEHQQRETMSRQSRSLARPDAARHLADALCGLAARGGKQ